MTRPFSSFFKAIMLTGMGEKGLGHQGATSYLIGQVFSHCLHNLVGVRVARADFTDTVYGACEEAARRRRRHDTMTSHALRGSWNAINNG